MTNKRTISKKSRSILGWIAKGYTYDQIVESNAGIGLSDIFSAAEEAIRVSDPRSHYKFHLAEIKLSYPKAYEPWTPADDADLIAMHSRGIQVPELSARFQRQPSAILSRLAKLGKRQESSQSRDEGLPW